MRILELINSLDTGGAERVVVHLALDLQAKGHSVHIVCLRELGVPPIPESALQASGIRIQSLHKADGLSRTVMTTLVSYMREEHIDLVHTHNPPVNHYGVLAARGARVPVVVNTLHGTATLEMRPMGKLLYAGSCLLTTRVVSVCRAVQEVSRKRVPLSEDRSVVIYNGIDLAPFLSVSQHPRDGKFRFGTVGRFVAVKDHHLLLEAFALAHSREPRTELHILGWGELESELRQRAVTLGISNAVCFRGFSREVPAFMGDVDCFVLSSRSEGLPMAVLEAMAAGLPVIGTAVGGVPELIEESNCGWVSPPRDPDQLARCMVEAVKADDLSGRGERARKSAIANYSVSRMGDEYLSLFHNLLSANGSRN